MATQLLKGVRVIDFTDFLAGPYCGMYLADMGADVIKFENLTTGGNFVRNTGPMEPVDGLSMYFQNLNRNKRGAALDLKSDGGKTLFARLIQSADVLIENNRPGVMERLGFGWEQCRQLNPRLIYASVSGFGQDGPYAARPGYDLTAQAMGGSMSVTGWPGAGPTCAGLSIADLMAGLNMAVAVCASLYSRQQTGKGNHIDISLVDTVFSGMEGKMMHYLYTGENPERSGNAHLTASPYDSFTAKDGDYVLATGTDRHFVSLAAAMGMPRLAEDPRFCDTPSRRANNAALKQLINDWGADKTVAEIVELCISCAGIPAAPIYSCAQVCHDKAIVETREMLVKVPGPKNHPGISELTVLGNPIKMEESPCVYYKAAPDLGEDNDEIFRELGFSGQELAAFRAAGAMN